MTPKTQVTKEKIAKLDFSKSENLCASKDLINRVKRQLKKWEKIFGNCISDKGLIPRIHKEFLDLNNKNTK